MGTRTCSPGRVLFGSEIKAIADAGVRTIERTGCELDDGQRATCGLNPPGSERRPRAKDVTVPVDEDHVDRKPHEERVNAATRREDQGAVVGEPRPAEEASVAAVPVERRFDEPRHYKFVTSVSQDPVRVRLREDRVQKPQDSLERRIILGRSVRSNGKLTDVGRAPIGPGARNWR